MCSLGITKTCFNLRALGEGTAICISELVNNIDPSPPIAQFVPLVKYPGLNFQNSVFFVGGEGLQIIQEKANFLLSLLVFLCTLLWYVIVLCSGMSLTPEQLTYSPYSFF